VLRAKSQVELDIASRDDRRQHVLNEVTKRALRNTNIGALVLNLMVAAWTWGHWHHFAIAVGLVAFILPTNVFVINRFSARYGIRAEIGRSLFNQAVCSIAYQWIGWPLPVWLWLPFMPLAFDSMASRQSIVVLAIMCGVQDVAALLGGVPAEIPIVFTTLAVMTWLLVNARVQIIRDMLVTVDERAEELAQAQTALAARTHKMRLVFDQIDQGLLVVDLDGEIASDHSAVVDVWLGPMPESRRLVDLVRRFAPARADWFAFAWSSLGDGLAPPELAVMQLPASFEVAGRHLAWSYKPFVQPDGSPRVLLVITDRTAELAHAREERRERETISLLSRALRDRAGFVESCDETARLVAAIEVADGAPVSFVRDVHTLKGVAGMLELSSLADACQVLESSLAEGDAARVAAERAAIAVRWRELAGLAEPFLDRARGRLDVLDSDVAELEAALARGASSAELVQIMAGWRDERAIDRLARVAELARSVATRLGKDPIEVAIECTPNLRLPARLAPLWSAFGHAVRNAIDHGIEPSEVRAAAGKSHAARLALRAGVRGDELVVELADDGCGIDWDGVAVAAEARGLPAATRGDLEAALFADGVSTSPLVTETSGRGVGLAALRAAVDSLGARTAIASSTGRGTTLQIAGPYRAQPIAFAS
jgi:HPt (histidine-containing phosphotransfer) domain-containing protein/PAS domain-containing protein